MITAQADAGRTSMRQAFMDALDRGWSTIPIGPNKKPRIKWKAYQSRRATPAIVDSWLGQWRDANLGIATGEISDLVVLDVDGTEGQVSLSRFDGLPLTVKVRTGRDEGGWQYYFRHPGFPVRNFAGELPGLDLRGDGGYVVAPPSIHPSGRQYTWEVSPIDIPLAPMPDWLLALVKKEPPPEPRRVVNLAAKRETGRLEQYARKGLEKEVDQLRSTAKGARNNQLNTAAFKMGQLVGAGLLNRTEVEGQLEQAAIDIGLGNDTNSNLMQIRASMQSGLDAGEHKPRQIPDRLKTRDAPVISFRSKKSPEPAPMEDPENETDEEIVCEEDDKPTIIFSNRQLPDMSAEALDALLTYNDPPRLFVRMAGLARIREDEHGKPVIEQLGETHLRGCLARVAHWKRATKTGELLNGAPPIDVVRDVLTVGEWPFPPLDAVVEVPTLRPDGSILDRRGYDPATRLFYAPDRALRPCTVPATPSKKDVAAAVALFDDVFGEFPYVDEASRANTLGLLLTPLVRPTIAGHVPLALIDAPRAGTGKGLLNESVAIIATGRRAAVMTGPHDEDEWRKRLTTALKGGATIITIDNVVEPLEAASLAAALTASYWEDRELGRNTMISVPQRATWVATGNNISLGGDIPRRCYWIRLDSLTARPWTRTGFRHPALTDYVAEHRTELLTALLTLVRAWFVAGKPPANTPAMATFSEWASIIDGILSHAGVRGFLGNLESLYDRTDEDANQWEAFLTTWLAEFGENPVTVTELCDALSTGDSTLGLASKANLQDALPDNLVDAMENDKKRAAGRSFRVKLGKVLAKKADIRYGDLRLQRTAEDSHAKIARWRVRKVK